MLLHPAYSLFYMSLMTSILITMSANSWFMAWLGLEMNLMSFVPLIINKKNKYSVESALKYFLVQAVASTFFIVFSSMQAYSQSSLTIPIAVLMVKAAAAPCHQWLPAVVDGMSWPLTAILTTLQKMNPLTMIFFIMKTNLILSLLYFFIFMSALVGAIGGLTQISMRKIMAYSAIAHLSWMLSTLLLNSWAWLVYFIMYAIILVSLIMLLNLSQLFYLNQLFTINKSYLSFLISASILSMGGLPPFSGFLPKLMTMTLLSNSPHNFVLIFLLSSSFISLFFYMRFILTTLMLASSSSSAPFKKLKMNFKLLHMNLIMLLAPSLSLVLM
uniref:NADH-ubiquinone oxidoreductase chain 2 n=1 Tax=Gmelinoides fasciatus TaxID=686704 RepID=A0A1L5BW51_9CRUS|nr:NADH dehydrogenase subunit 2 [Gmelinoides fasciatus]APL97195.1 NADH dehydrogenase subunit 2 [Gmelinoides fasciatus]